jgi:hypothetical protein
MRPEAAVTCIESETRDGCTEWGNKPLNPLAHFTATWNRFLIRSAM